MGESEERERERLVMPEKEGRGRREGRLSGDFFVGGKEKGRAISKLSVNQGSWFLKASLSSRTF